MNVARVGQVQTFRSDGVISNILLRWGSFEARNLLISWTTIAPGGEQHSHTHSGTEQAYIVIAGMGRMQVREEHQLVSAGTLVFVPPGVPHSISNPGDEDLTYITAASPPFPVERFFAANRAGGSPAI